MSAQFERRSIEENTWKPEVLGVSFEERLMKMLGVCAVRGIEVWTVFVTVEDDDTGEGYTEQVTPENCQVIISDLDDDSDSILLRDRRDGMFFRFNRLNHPDIFDDIAATVAPWAQRFSSLIPSEQQYRSVLNQLEGDLGDELTVPDDWS